MLRHEGEIRYRYYVSLWLPAAVVGALLVLVLIMQLTLSWMERAQLDPVNRHMNLMLRLQTTNLELQRELLESLTSESAFTNEERRNMRDELAAIIGMQAHLSKDTPPALSYARDALDNVSRPPREALIIALSHLRTVIDHEADAHQRLIREVNRTATFELRIAAISLLVFPASAVILLYLLRRRILAPLNNLGALMTMLIDKKYSPAPVDAIDPVLRPLAENFNAMVARLEQLEHAHVRREQDLEEQVDNATRVLLDQQRSLASAERLATVGEMMARIAHELRNPLAGVKLACTNLRQELNQQALSPEYRERLDVVSGEVDRIIALLNSLLEQSRHKPEAPRELNLAGVIADLVTLARYQIPEHITVEHRVAADAVCRLPVGLLRQALLNLLLNASQAIGDASGRIVIDGQVQEGKLHLIVSDDGPGFPQDVLDSGIRAFVSQRPEGTGLGLSMVQRFVREYRGTITLENLDPRGACVSVELPCNREKHA